MVNIEKIRVTQEADLGNISMTTADMMVVVDRAITIANGTVPMPANPIEGQIFTLTSRVAFTALTMNAAGRTIYGNITSLAAGVAVGWIYDLGSDAWFAYNYTSATYGRLNGTLSDQTDLQTTLNTKLATNGNGALLTGLTKTQVGLANVDNTADTAKPVSTAQQTALDLKLGVGTVANVVYSRVTGSNATTTGQVLVDVTGLSNALVANAVYEFEAVLSCSTTAVTTGTAYGVNYSAAGATIESHIMGASSSTATKTLRIAAFNSATSLYLATSGQTGGITIKGIVTTGANAGNLTISHLKLTSGTSTVMINSFLKTIRIS